MREPADRALDLVKPLEGAVEIVPPPSSRRANVASGKKSVIGKERDAGLPVALTREEAHDLIAAGDSVRDRLLLEAMYRTGARATEIALLRRRDIRADGLELANLKQRDPSKGRKLVYIDAPEFCGRLLLWCNEQGIGDDNFVFPSRKGSGPLGRDQVRRIVAAASSRAGILLTKHGKKRPAWAHVLRHSAVVRWLEGTNGNIEFGAAQAGHASIRSMDPYRAIADEQRRRLVRGCEF